MRTKRREPVDRAAECPLPAPRPMRQPMRQTRAALGDIPERLFGSRTGMSQMSGRDPFTKAIGQLGSVSHAHPNGPRPPSLLPVVPSAPLFVKGYVSPAREDAPDTLDMLLAGTGPRQRCQSCSRQHSAECPGCQAYEGGAR